MPTKKFLFDKLGRDNAPELIEASGGKLKYHVVANDDEFLDAVTQKVVEELEEVFESQSKQEVIEELGDLEEILATFKKLIGVTQEEIDAARTAKREKKGAFEKRIYCEYAEVEEGSDDDIYLSKQPEKYPQIEKEIESEEELFGE